MNKCVVLIGPPCSGKSTIGKELASNIGYKYISSGDIARKMAEEDGTMDNLNAGKMAPEDRMRDEIKSRFDGTDIILDGFPRFTEQFEWMVCTIKYEFIFIVVDAGTISLFNRVAQRGRTDDIAFIERLEYYMKNTVPMVNVIDSHCTLHGDTFALIMNNDLKDARHKIGRCLYGCGWLR